MKSFEAPPQDSLIAEDVDKRVREILDGPPLNDYTKRQMQLAVEKFIALQPDVRLDSKTLDDVMLAWSDTGSLEHYSEIWNKFVKHPGFKAHNRFQGSYANVTLEDLEAFGEKGCKELPE